MRSQNRTVLQVAIAQGAAGSTDLVAAPGVGLRIKVVAFVVVMGALGSAKFTEGTGPTDLTGAMPVAANGSLQVFGDGDMPIFETQTANSKLSILTVTGAGTGWLRYFIEA